MTEQNTQRRGERMKQQRTLDKQIVKEAIKVYKPSETISHDKKGWYCSELEYRW